MGYRKASSALGNKTLYSASMKSDNYIWSAGELTGKSVKMVIWHLRYVFLKKIFILKTILKTIFNQYFQVSARMWLSFKEHLIEELILLQNQTTISSLSLSLFLLASIPPNNYHLITKMLTLQMNKIKFSQAKWPIQCHIGKISRSRIRKNQSGYCEFKSYICLQYIKHQRNYTENMILNTIKNVL